MNGNQTTFNLLNATNAISHIYS